MLNKLFRPKWQHANPEIRKTAIAKLDNNDAHILEQLAIADESALVRQAAIAKIEDLSILERLMIKAKTTAEQELAQRCWTHTLTESGKFSALDAEQVIIECTNEKLLGAIIAYSDNASLRELALAGISSEPALLALMENTRNVRIWQAISAKLVNEDALKKAILIINGRDKKSQHIIKSKLESLKSLQQSIQQNEAQAEQLTNKLQHLLKTESNPLFEGIVLTAKQQFTTLAQCITTERASLIQSLIQDCENRLHAQQQQKAQITQTHLQESAGISRQQQLLQQLHSLLAESQTPVAPAAAITQSLDDIKNQWQALAAPENQQEKFRQALSSINNLVLAINLISKKSLVDINDNSLSQRSFADTQALLQDTKSLFSLLDKAGADKSSEIVKFAELLQHSLEKHKQALLQASQQLHKEIRQDLAETESLVEIKNLKKAQKVFTQIQQALEKLPEHDARAYDKQTQRLFHAIKNLEDWKNFAGDEKRIELCEHMQKLSDKAMDPQTKADAIKSLQQEWKALGHCHDQKLWEKFKSIADTAYAPCQEYFNKQKEVRQFNASQCRVICEQLEKLLAEMDWNAVDWKNMENLYRAIHEEWKKYSSLGRDEYRILQDRFYQSANVLKDKLNEERKHNHDKLDTLIKKANDLLSLTDAQQAVSDYGNLQQQWKSTGITHHREQQRQWHAFKKAGDALYEKRQNLRHEAEHERQANLAIANNIIRDIFKMAHLGDDELAASKASFESMKTRFKTLTSLPKDDFKSCLQEFHNACDAYENSVSKISQRQQEKQLQILQDLANEWQAAESRGEQPDIKQAKSLLPEKWLSHLYKRIEPLPTSTTTATATENARILCIEMETLAGIATPPEDATLKMNWQMANLAKNFGQAQTQSAQQKVEDLYLRWFAQPCWNEVEYKLLQERFLNAAKSVTRKNNPA